jgi:hypothetical protein
MKLHKVAMTLISIRWGHNNADANTNASLEVESYDHKVEVCIIKLTMLHQEVETDLLDSSSYQKFLLYIMIHHQSRMSSINKPLQVGGWVPKKSRKHWHPFAHFAFFCL